MASTVRAPSALPSSPMAASAQASPRSRIVPRGFHMPPPYSCTVVGLSNRSCNCTAVEMWRENAERRSELGGRGSQHMMQKHGVTAIGLATAKGTAQRQIAIRRRPHVVTVVQALMQPVFEKDTQDRGRQTFELKVLDDFPVLHVATTLDQLLKEYDLSLDPRSLSQTCLDVQKVAVADGYPICEVGYMANALEGAGVPEGLALLMAVEIADAFSSFTGDCHDPGVVLLGREGRATVGQSSRCCVSSAHLPWLV